MGTMQRTKWGCVARRLVISLLRFSWGLGEGRRHKRGKKQNWKPQWTSPIQTNEPGA